MLVNNEVIKIYKKIPKFVTRHIHAALQEVLGMGAIMKIPVGGKRKAKMLGEDVILKPQKKMDLIKKVNPSLVDEEIERSYRRQDC